MPSLEETDKNQGLYYQQRVHTWLSVVRAPMAPQATRSAVYCGEIVSRNSVPHGTPNELISMSSCEHVHAYERRVKLARFRARWHNDEHLIAASAIKHTRGVT